MRHEEITTEFKQMIVQAVDSSVRVTGYPVSHRVLKAVGVTRAMAKKLAHEGVLNDTYLTFHGQLIKGYYATVLPKSH